MSSWAGDWAIANLDKFQKTEEKKDEPKKDDKKKDDKKQFGHPGGPVGE